MAPYWSQTRRSLPSGKTDDVAKHELLKAGPVEEIECRGKVVLPGFVDSHTHPVFTTPRLVDFEKRTAGANYEEIAAAGGGIRASLRGVRESSREELASHVLRALRGDGRARHHHGGSEVGLWLELRRRDQVAGSNRATRRDNGRERWFPRCWARMSLLLSIERTRKNMSASSAKR